MKKKIILISVVIFVSFGLLNVSKIVQDKYLNKKNINVEQKAKSETSKEATSKPTDKKVTKPIIIKAPEKTIAQSKTITQGKTTTNSKTEEKIPQTKATASVIAEVPKVVTKTIVKKTPEPKKQPNLVIKDSISGKIILSMYISTENKTVGEVTISELDNRGISYSAQGRGQTVYFNMINNLKARGSGALSGWCYYVNGSKPGVSCGAYKLKSDDVVTWKYLKDAINN